MSLKKILAFGVFTADLALAGSFMPENDLHLEDTLENSTIARQTFDEAIDHANRIYQPIVSAHGGRLVIKKKWYNPTVNAYATQRGSTWEVNMFGGLARRSEVTADGFALVICHELGHHLAGFPFVQSWASNEGQSDYFATQSCARLLWGDQLEKNALSRNEIPQYPKALCDEKWTDENEQNLCYRNMLAGHSLATLLGALGRQIPNFDTPDSSIVDSTDHSHPKAQCRLDTYMAGALCSVAFNENLIPGKSSPNRNSRDAEIESSENLCTRYHGHTNSTRPLCWFAPNL